MRYLYMQVIFFVSFVAQEITDSHVISLQLVDKLRPKVQVKVQNGRKHQKERQKTWHVTVTHTFIKVYIIVTRISNAHSGS